jgi:hypothetical protein
MAGQNDRQRLIDDSRHLMDDSKKVFDDVQQLYDNMRNKGSLGEYYQQNPYAMLATAAGVGYVLGGGLFSPFTKRVLKLAMKGLVIPIAGSQFKNLSASGHASHAPAEGGE